MRANREWDLLLTLFRLGMFLHHMGVIRRAPISWYREMRLSDRYEWETSRNVFSCSRENSTLKYFKKLNYHVRAYYHRAPLVQVLLIILKTLWYSSLTQWDHSMLAILESTVRTTIIHKWRQAGYLDVSLRMRMQWGHQLVIIIVNYVFLKIVEGSSKDNLSNRHLIKFQTILVVALHKMEVEGYELP